MQLIYRGSQFSFQPTATPRTNAVLTATRTLLYRGLVYSYRKPESTTQVFPKAMNWRFAQVCQSTEMLSPAHA